jgi:hypothetical protein
MRREELHNGKTYYVKESTCLSYSNYRHARKHGGRQGNYGWVVFMSQQLFFSKYGWGGFTVVKDAFML